MFLSTVVGPLTSKGAAALILGSFTELVTGYATPPVLGNAVAGLFSAPFCPIRVGDEVTAAGKSGKVVAISAYAHSS